MTAYQFFGLRVAPFDGRPDPRFFYRASGHAEALATLQYAVHAAKAGVVLLGDSGTGKSLLARQLADENGARRACVWVHGIGQPADHVDVTITPPRSEDPAALGTIERPLREWWRQPVSAGDGTIVLVDNADGLNETHWNEIVGVVTRDQVAGRPLTVVLLGLPALATTLAAGRLARLRRRVFRTFMLGRLSAEETRAYITHRLTVAGGPDARAIFTEPALDLVHRLAGGNPALINQVCDNALIDAFGDERRQIDVTHIVGTIRAITGGLVRQPLLPSPTRRAYGGGGNGSTAVEPDLAGADANIGMPPTPPPVVERPAADVIMTPPPGPAVERTLDQRIRVLESNLNQALARIRTTRRPVLPSEPPPTVPDEDTPPVVHVDVEVLDTKPQ